MYQSSPGALMTVCGTSKLPCKVEGQSQKGKGWVAPGDLPI